LCISSSTASLNDLCTCARKSSDPTTSIVEQTLQTKNARMPPSAKKPSKEVKKDDISHPQATVQKQAVTLPFDVLSLIFEECLPMETVDYPIEKLLLVCRSWSHAALHHGRLWCTYRIRCHEFAFWINTIPRRLARSPPNSLLDIEISDLDIPRKNDWHMCDKYEKVLRCLTGLEGEIAHRWRRFIVWTILDYYNVFQDEEGDSVIADFLCFPTPHLRELQMRHLMTSKPFFPFTPSLKIFHAVSITTPSLPDLSTASEIGVSNRLAKVLAKVDNLESLSIFKGDAGDYSLSITCPRLRLLCLSTSLEEDGLKIFLCPQSADSYSGLSIRVSL